MYSMYYNLHINRLLIIICFSLICNFSYALSKKLPTIVIGISTDASGRFADSGESERRGIMMAIKEFNDIGGVLGRRIDTIHINTKSDPKVAKSIAEEFILKHKVAFLIGSLHSGFAAEFSKTTQKYGVVFLNTNSSSPGEAGKNCHRTKFVWDGNGTNFTKATIKNAVRWIGNRWILLTHDYEWGHQTSAITQKYLEEAGGEVIKNLLVPENVTDFTPFLEVIHELQPNVVATVIGGKSLQSLQAHVKEAGQDRNPAWISNQQDWPDVWLSGKQDLFGIFGTTWYHKFDLPGVKEFVARYKSLYPNSPIPVPGNVFYNGYMATRELLQAVERVGTTNNHMVIKELERLKVPAVERMQDYDGFMNPDTHHFQQAIYMATVNPAPVDIYDVFTIISHIPPQEIIETNDNGKCLLESFEKTPVYEP